MAALSRMCIGTMKDLIREGLEEDAVVEGKRDKNLSKIVDEIQEQISYRNRHMARWITASSKKSA